MKSYKPIYYVYLFVVLIFITTTVFFIQQNEFNYNTSFKPPHIKPPWYSIAAVLKRTENCDKYFDTFPVLALQFDFAEFEMQNILDPFSLAFSHLVHTDIAILEVFLSVYFRPNNFHCIHVDTKASYRIKEAVSNLVECYSRKTQNGSIFIIPEHESIDVNWGANTILLADIKCHKKLLENSVNGNIPWRYSLSVAGSELPILSYSRFHNKISQNLGKGESSLESFPISNNNLQNRFSKQLSVDHNSTFDKISPHIFQLPYNKTTNITLQVFKGSRNVILSAKDANFIMNHPVSRYLYYWFLQASNAEEHFYATMIRINVDPGTNMITQNTSGKVLRKNSAQITFTEGNTLHGLCPRYALWGCVGCHGQCYNAVCNFHRLDLDKIAKNSTDCLMANKFNLEVDPLAVTLHLLNLFEQVSIDTQSWRNSDWSTYYSKITSIML